MMAGCNSVTDADHTNNLQLQTSESEMVTLSNAQIRVDVCHLNGTGEYNKITVADAAFETHLAHGDGEIGGDVPGLDGYIFDENCEPELIEVVVDVCPCFSQESIEEAIERSSFQGVYLDIWGDQIALYDTFFDWYAQVQYDTCTITDYKYPEYDISKSNITQGEAEACKAILLEYE
jgi:hypothetical protein